MLKIKLISWREEFLTVTQSKAVPGYSTHTLRGTALFLFSKIDPVIVFVLLNCYSIVTILIKQISN